MTRITIVYCRFGIKTVDNGKVYMAPLFRISAGKEIHEFIEFHF